MPSFIDLTGHKFGRLTALHLLPKDPKRQNRPYWLFRCDCGREKAILGAQVSNGRTISCGCAQTDYRKGKARASFLGAQKDWL